MATITEGGRVQLALRVSDLDAAVEFYGKLFDAKPAKVRDRYANFAIASPPLKLVLIEGEGGGGIDHLGVEVGTTDAVGAVANRLATAGLATFAEDNVECCHARQDKVWVHGPDGEPWEVYTVLGDSETLEKAPSATATAEGAAGTEACCDTACCA